MALAPGEYRLRLWLHSYNQDIFDEVPVAVPLRVQEAPLDGCREYDRAVHGFVATPVRVQTS
jgi:hypothetical protein